MKDGDGKKTFKLGLIVTHGIQTPKTKPTKSPTTRLSHSLYASQWLEDLFCSKQKAITLLIIAFNASELTLPPFVEPSQYNEPPIPGPSQSSKSPVPSYEDIPAHDPEPEVALMQSMEDPFGKLPLSFFSCSQHSLTPPLNISSLSRYPHFVIIIDDRPVGAPSHCPQEPNGLLTPAPSSPNSHHEAWQEFTNL
ncbi:hypothetical protein O181_026269 [Austropuccinia psidii MF-1]|uniref:Uncharacterized protein n=1 Tax=Austropuccinia psidii MF-1 TaxID=1389203 RepID=A0A9Q3CJM8_9BASI|nr:hypothetical protein [Austropuccinia psidii MF-1]